MDLSTFSCRPCMQSHNAVPRLAEESIHRDMRYLQRVPSSRPGATNTMRTIINYSKPLGDRYFCMYIPKSKKN